MSLLDELPLATRIPTSCLPLGRLTYTDKEVREGTETLSVLPGGVSSTPKPGLRHACSHSRPLNATSGIKLVPRTYSGVGGGQAQLIGLPYFATYPEGNGKYSLTHLPYYSCEHTNSRKMQLQMEEMMPPLMEQLYRFGGAMMQAGVTDRLLRGSILRQDAGQPRVALVSTSGFGKTTLINVLAHRARLDKAAISAASGVLANDGIVRLQPCENLGGGAAEALLYEPGQLTLAEFEKAVKTSEWFVATLDKIIKQADRWRRRKGDEAVILGYRGPAIAIPNNPDASSYVPSTVEASPNKLFTLHIPFLSKAEVATACGYARRAQFEPGFEEEVEDQEIIRQIKLGRELYGFVQVPGVLERQPPRRLEGVAEAQWSLPRMAQLFVGRNLEVSFRAETWEEGCAKLHDAQMLFCRSDEGPWAFIRPEGFTIQVPSAIIRYMDLPGDYPDGTVRDDNLTYVLRTMAPDIHAFVMLVQKHVPPAVIERLKHHVQVGLNSTATASQLAEGRVPATIVMLDVVDRLADSDLPLDELLSLTTDPKSSRAKACEDGLRDKCALAFGALVPSRDLFDKVHCFSVAAVRSVGYGMAELEAALKASNERHVAAMCRKLARVLVSSCHNVLAVLAASRLQAKARGEDDIRNDNAHLQSAKSELSALLHEQVDFYESGTDGRYREGKYSKLELIVEEVLQPRVVTPILNELRDFLDIGLREATGEGLQRALDAVNLGPTTDGGAPSPATLDMQLKHLRYNKRGSNILLACLQPLFGAVAKFASITLPEFSCKPSLPDDLTGIILERLVPRLSAEVRLLDVNEAEGRGIPANRIESWVFAQTFRRDVLKEVTNVVNHLGAVSYGDLDEAAIQCGGAMEHFRITSNEILTAIPPRCPANEKVAKYRARIQKLVELYCTATPADQPGLYAKISGALEECIWNYVYDLCPLIAERIKNIVKSYPGCGGDDGMRNGGDGSSMDAAADLLRLAAPAMRSPSVAGARKREREDYDLSFSQRQTENIQQILEEVKAALKAHNVDYGEMGSGGGLPSPRTLRVVTSADLAMQSVVSRVSARATARAEEVSPYAVREQELWKRQPRALMDLIRANGISVTQKRPRKANLVAAVLKHEFSGGGGGGAAGPA